MELQFLGTGTGQPSKSRSVSSLVLKLLDEINKAWMFDCGEGTQHQILEAIIKPRKVKHIFVTHLHEDHIFGLPGFLAGQAFQINEEQTNLDVYGSIGIRSYILNSLRLSGTRLPYRIHFHELGGNSLGKAVETDKFVVYTEKLDHTIFCIGYRVTQKDLKGTLDVEALKAAGVPFGSLFGKIKSGQGIILGDGTKVIAKDYISAPKKGRIITILGDIRKTDTSVRLGLGANILVRGSTYGKGDEKIVRKHGHSVNMRAAQIAKEASAKMLLLNHVNARFLERECKQVEDDARTVFENTHLIKGLGEISL